MAVRVAADNAALSSRSTRARLLPRAGRGSMDLTNLVDVAIGLCLVYLGASLFVTIVNEYIGQVLRLRGRQLAGDLKQLINDEGIQKRLKASPALAPFFDTAGGSFKRPRELQSYVHVHVFGRLPPGGLQGRQHRNACVVNG